MGRIFKYLIGLENFRNIILHSITIIEGLVAVASNLEVLVVNLVSDNGHVGHFDVGERLL